MAETLRWLKARASGQAGCIEMALAPEGRVAIRDSKNPDGGMLTLASVEFAAWVAGAKRGDYDFLLDL